MNIGTIIIYSNKHTERKVYVDNIINFFKDTPVTCHIIEGIFTNKEYYDAREGLDNNKLSKGQIGCSLAHMNAMKLALDLNYDYVFIFEDDVIINKDCNYNKLNNWINNLPKFDICLITNVGHRNGYGRIHKNTYINNNLMYVSCPFGTMAYYISKNILKNLYDNQVTNIKNNKIHIADALFIHYEKEKNKYLDIITPQNKLLFFYEARFDENKKHKSIIDNLK